MTDLLSEYCESDAEGRNDILDPQNEVVCACDALVDQPKPGPLYWGSAGIARLALRLLLLFMLQMLCVHSEDLSTLAHSFGYTLLTAALFLLQLLLLLLLLHVTCIAAVTATSTAAALVHTSRMHIVCTWGRLLSYLRCGSCSLRVSPSVPGA